MWKPVEKMQPHIRGIWLEFKRRLQKKVKPEVKPVPEEEIFPEELSLKATRKKEISPLNAPVWRDVLVISAGCAAGWIIHILLGFYHPIAIWLGVLVTGISWVVAVRMLLLDSRAKKFWIGWLSAGFLFLIIKASGIWIVSASFVFFFLLIRRYKPFRHLTSRRRSGLFLIGFISFILLTIGWLLGKPGGLVQSQELSRLATLELNIARYFLWSLRMFWLLSLFHLFFAIRLHFLKLKPKLAVSALLIAVLPLLLVIIIGIVFSYGILGESRATRAGAILNDWASLAVLDENFMPTLSGKFFSYQTAERGVHIRGEQPSWLPEFLSALNKDKILYEEWIASDKARYFLVGSELWLFSLGGDGRTSVQIRGCLVDKIMLDRLAFILKSDVSLNPSSQIITSSEGRQVEVKTDETERESPSLEKYISGNFLPQTRTPQDSGLPEDSIWKRSLYFGMSHLDVVSFDSGEFIDRQILLMVKTSLQAIGQELFSERNILSLAVMGVILALAVFMFILEVFALIFGLRISTGITSAIRLLHRGTRRIAAGDLETKIVIPNEDELGDLATSFNMMTAAVRKGREEAVARAHLERELETARQIQEKLLPHEMPLVPGFEIAGTSLPSQQVGGDYFDFLDMGTGQIGIAIADVSGKGIPAALLMANLQASLHAQALRKGSVAEVVSRMNNLLVRSTDTHMFATFFYGILDRKKSTFSSTNAGHNPPLLFRAKNKIERLSKGGLVLGFLADQQYAEQVVNIEPGEVIILSTDGIPEAIGPSEGKITGNLFGEERLIETVKSNLSKSASEIQSAILKAITEHTANTPQSDDITLVVIKRKG